MQRPLRRFWAESVQSVIFFVCEWLLAMCSDSSGAWKLSFLEQLNEVEFLNSGRVGEGCGNLH